MFKFLKIIFGVVLLLIGLAIFVSGVKTFFDKSRYLATARVKIELQTNNASDYGQADSDTNLHFIQKQYGIILSEAVLGEAAHSLNLNSDRSQQFGDGTILKSHLSLVPIRNTKLLEIECRSEEPRQAAAIANSVTRAYQKNRSEIFEEAIRKNLSTTNIARVQIIDLAEPPASPMPMLQISMIMLVTGLVPLVGGWLLLKSSRRLVVQL